MDNNKRVPIFRNESCDMCGLCLHLCPVLRLPLEEAKIEIQNLIARNESKCVLNKCNTCFSCNLYCPKKANPYQLILENWNDLYKRRGAPPLYRFVCPTEKSNIWQLLNLFLSNQERRWIYKWMHCVPKPEDDILLIGNYTHLFPFIIGGSKLLEYFKPVDRIDHWEAGAYLYQGGYLDVVQKIAKQIKGDFTKWGIKNVFILTDSVEFQFSKIHPEEMSVNYDQKFINFNKWLLDAIVAGRIKLINTPLNMRITVHDNCYSKTFEGAYWDTARGILEKCGCKINEMKHIKKDSLCCGFGAGASWVKNISIPFDIISEGTKKFKEAEETGAKVLVSYCSGCIYLLWATRELLRSKMDIFHVVEIVRMAMGEHLNYPKDHVKRAWDVIAIITYSLLLSIIRKNFYIKKIEYDKELSTFKPKKHRLLKIIRYMFEIPFLKYVFSKMFKLMMSLMKPR